MSVALRPGQVQRAPIDLRTAEGMLQYVDGAEDRPVWLAVGMALKSEFGNDAYDAWDRWSQQANNYHPGSCRSSWRGFKASTSGGYSIGTLIKFAKDGGYRFAANDAPAPDAQDLARRRAEREARAQAEHQEREQMAANAEQVALQYWRAAARTGVSQYAVRKGIPAPESVRFLSADAGGGLVVPMLRYDLPREQALKGVQIIKDDGTKKFTYGMQKPGTACRLGLAVVGDPVLVCEGYATGMSLRMALASAGMHHAVFVAFDAYNLPVVVQNVFQMLPGSPIIICADDDHATTLKGLPHNPGRIQAQVAMDGVMDGPTGAKLVVRTFPLFARATARTDKDTDFNDLHRLEGLPEVAAQLQVCFEAIQQLKQYA